MSSSRRKSASPKAPSNALANIEFLIDGLVRGDLQSRYTAYQIGRQAGFLSVNDIRSFENMNPISGGDRYLEPLNMQAIE